MPNPTITIGGVDRTDKTRVNTVSIRRSINDRSTMTCELVEMSGTYRPVAGQQITLDQWTVAGSPGSNRRWFGGYIERINERPIPGVDGGIEYRLDCVDYSRILDWRLYAGSFDAGTAFSTVVTTIFNAKLSGDGVTLGTVASYPNLTARIQDGLRPLTEWFRKLATDTGHLFRFDPYKVLSFGPLATSPPNFAPFSLTWTSGNWRDMEVNRELGDYRNRQYVRTEYTTSGELTSDFTGDGSTRDFFQYDGPFTGTPTVTVNSVALTVGRFGIDTGYDVYYDVEGWGIHFVSPASPPSGGAAIEITYRVRFNNSLMVQDSAQIAARATIQGDSGVIEAIHEDRYIDTAAGLQARADALLRQFGAVATEVSFGTDSYVEPDSDDTDPGMMISINLTGGDSDINDTFLIEAIESRWVRSEPDDIWFHTFRCTDLEPHGQRSVAPVERIAEILRIGPDVATVVDESPAPTPVVSVLYLETHTLSSGTNTINSAYSPTGNVLLAIQITQNGSGNGTVSWGSDFDSSTPDNVTPTAGARSLYLFVASASKWTPVSLMEI